MRSTNTQRLTLCAWATAGVPESLGEATARQEREGWEKWSERFRASRQGLVLALSDLGSGVAETQCQASQQIRTPWLSQDATLSDRSSLA